MARYKGSLLGELKKMARGRKTTLPPEMIADWAIGFVRAALEDDDVLELKRMYRLDDPRN